MASVNRFVVVIDYQYSRQSFQNRARLRTPDGYQWITIPIIGGQHGKTIETVRIDNSQIWARKHERALTYNYGKAPYFEHYAPDIFNIIGNGSEYLKSVTVESTVLVHRLLQLECELVIQSESSQILAQIQESSPEEYVILPEGYIMSDTDKTANPCRILKYVQPRYRQQFERFEPGMSVLDLLFGYGPSAADILRQGIAIDDSTL